MPSKLGFTLKQGFILFILASMEESTKYSWVLLHVENHRQISAPGMHAAGNLNKINNT